jgi:Domain of unknown function (DUF4411)
MLYLLDSSVLIDANRDDYPLKRVPQFWDWLPEPSNAGGRLTLASGFISILGLRVHRIWVGFCCLRA